MSSVSYFPNSKKFSVNTLSISNTLVASDPDALQHLRQHAAGGAMHDSDERYPPPKCHPGTRQAVRDRITGWYGFKTRPEKGIMWVYGPAGYSKNAVAQTVSDDLEGQQLEFNPVGATFFFSRASPERNSPARFIITLTYQLAISIPELLPQIEKAVKRNPMIFNKSLEVQLTRLIVEPFRALDNLDDIPNRLIVIDGLDECINSDQAFHLERNRPEVWIQEHMESRQFKPVTEVINLYEVGDHLHDVEAFLRAELSRIAARLEPQLAGGNFEWPGKDTLKTLLQRTRGHMLYASTVIRHIDDPYDDPRRLLQDILHDESEDKFASGSSFALAHSSSFSALHELYRQILRSCPEAHRQLMLEVLEELIAFSETLFIHCPIGAALSILDRLCGRPAGQSIKAIRNLRAVITLDCVTFQHQIFVHSSFSEFLLNPQAALEFAVNRRGGHWRLLLRCLRCMSSVDLSSEVNEAHVRFALVYWLRLWGSAEPSDEAQYATQLKLLLALNLKACIVQGLIFKLPPLALCFNLVHVNSGTLVPNIPSVHARETIIGRFCEVALELGQQTTALAEECASFLKSSLEHALLYMLQPAFVLVPRTPSSITRICFLLQNYFRECNKTKEWNPGADKVIQAMKSFKNSHPPHIHQEIVHNCDWGRQKGLVSSDN
ncbi:hypothetical protein EST38_g14125 [Candolleomyces aberdarensis]|uniref:Nephrocystin 3-like N-terminal domain-containing protein n=1 Tax=Candolleomyces aberdarensis TaxID=2316362 RepID=A0A4Q2CY37_9AGAR|nr:hypothetical protein EST38_g14125 [Candolleomyces aberdarensis]